MRSGKATDEPAPPIQSVRRAVRLIEQLATEESAIPLGRLSKKVGLHVSTTHRLLSTLKADGFVQQDAATGRYLLGYRLIFLGQQHLERIDLRGALRPFMEQLRQRTGETVNLVVLDQDEAVYLDTVEGQQSLRIFSRIGHRAPLHCTAAGKVLLAAMPEWQVGGWLASRPLEALTSQTLTDPVRLRQELEQVRAEGFALDREECEEAIGCIAAPAQNSRGETIAAVSISVPSIRMRARRILELAPQIVHVASQMSEQLGHHTHTEPQGAPAGSPGALRPRKRGGDRQSGKDSHG